MGDRQADSESGSEEDEECCCLGAAASEEFDRLVEIDFEAGCENHRVTGLVADTNKLVEAPAQNLLRRDPSELLELRGSHGPPRSVTRWWGCDRCGVAAH